jgi:hypothetical protein
MPETKRDEHWCPTCGKTNVDDNDCPKCAQWWKDNPPPAIETKRDERPIDVSGLIGEDIPEHSYHFGSGTKLAAPAPQSQDARELSEKMRDRYWKAFNADDISENDINEVAAEIERFVAARLSAPAEKKVPMTMLRDCGHHYMDKGKLRKVAERYHFKVTED